MKKLMIAAAIVCAAVMSQAASVTWKWTSTAYDAPNKVGSTHVAYQGTVYIFNANSVTQQAILDAAGDLSKFTAMDSFTTNNGKNGTGATITSDSTTFAPVRTEGGVKYADYFYAMVTTGADGKDYVFLSDTNSKSIQSAQDTSLTVSLSTPTKTMQEGTTFTAGGWYSTVPEPTSGLLLLLGVAGLALRRRRA